MTSPIASNRIHAGHAPVLRVEVEKLQFLGYASFWLVVLVGVVTTKMAGVDTANSILVEVFGYNNICAFFDSPPATYLLPFFWSITLVLLLAYLGADWLQLRIQLEQGNVDQRLYKHLCRLKIFEAFTLACFSTIFSVHPEGWDQTLYIHTAPFFLVQIGLVSLAMSNTLYGIKSGYWRRLELPAWFTKMAVIYCLLFAVVVGFKIPAAVNAMAHSQWWNQTSTFKLVARSFDGLFLLFAGVVPMAKAAYLMLTRAEKLEAVQLFTSTGTS